MRSRFTSCVEAPEAINPNGFSFELVRRLVSRYFWKHTNHQSVTHADQALRHRFNPRRCVNTSRTAGATTGWKKNEPRYGSGALKLSEERWSPHKTGCASASPLSLHAEENKKKKRGDTYTRDRDDLDLVTLQHRRDRHAHSKKTKKKNRVRARKENKYKKDPRR